jgi:anti-sigma factor RsiW
MNCEQATILLHALIDDELDAGHARAPSLTSVSGYNIRRWSDGDLDLVAVSDLNSEELSEFAEKFQAGLRAGNTL